MTVGALQSRSLMAAEHLQLLRSLAAELERAMRAIASNQLCEFEDSVASQRDLSNRLNQLAGELSTMPHNAALVPSDSISVDLTWEIHAAASELQNLNLRYSCLLQHASRSAAQMVSLFHSFKGQIKEVPGGGSKVQTWSCQV